MRIPNGDCVPLKKEYCLPPWVFIDGATKKCVECNAEAGFIYADDSCTCDSSRYLAGTESGECGCSSSALEYDKVIGECYCKNGMNMTFADGAVQCEQGCPSGVFDYERPQICVDKCPSHMVLYN